MTLHIFYDHACPDCKAEFIPYLHALPCPQCGAVSQEHFDYVPQAAASLAFNLSSYKSYVPPAWYSGSLGDRLLYLLFRLFESFRQQERSPDFSEFAGIFLSQVKWGDHGYLRNHVAGLALRIHEVHQNTA
jgi:hypothetical protein